MIATQPGNYKKKWQAYLDAEIQKYNGYFTLSGREEC